MSFCRLTHAVPQALRPPVHPHWPLPSQVRVPGQAPHEPPQPSEPQTLPAHEGVQQAPTLQTWPATQQAAPQVTFGHTQAPD